MDEYNSADSGIQDNSKGMSNTTIAVLIILALLISIIGTWAVLNTVSPSSLGGENTNGNVAVVTLNILPSAGTKSTTNGEIVLDIKR
jgi:hypothetical protein